MVVRMGIYPGLITFLAKYIIKANKEENNFRWKASPYGSNIILVSFNIYKNINHWQIFNSTECPELFILEEVLQAEESGSCLCAVRRLINDPVLQAVMQGRNLSRAGSTELIQSWPALTVLSKFSLTLY